MRIRKIIIQLEPNESEKKMVPVPPIKDLIFDDGFWFVQDQRGLRAGEIRLSNLINEVRDKVGSI